MLHWRCRHRPDVPRERAEQLEATHETRNGDRQTDRQADGRTDGRTDGLHRRAKLARVLQ